MSEIRVVHFPEEEKKKGLESERILRDQMKLEYSFLKKGDTDGYLSCRDSFETLKLKDYHPNIFDIFNLAEGKPRTLPFNLSTTNYLTIYYNNRMRSQDDLSEYITSALIGLKRKKVITNFDPEYQTKHGRCDLFIEGKNPFLLELKTDKILRKDIFQCHEFKKTTDDNYQTSVVGYGCDEKAIPLAKEYGISVYGYKVSKTIPTKIDVYYICGERIKTIPLLFGHEYILKEWRVV